MEEVALFILIEIGGFILNSIIYFPWDFLVAFGEGKSNKPNYILVVILSILVAAVLAKISVLVLQEAIIPFGWARVVNLLLAPLVAGYVAFKMSNRREQAGKNSKGNFHYIVAFLFTFTFIGTRYVLTTA